MISVHLRMFEKIARFDSRAKICFGKKSVIFAVSFAGSRRSSGAGNGIKKIRSLAQRFDQRRFTRA